MKILIVILVIILVVLIVKRSDILAVYARSLYFKDEKDKALKYFEIAEKIGTLNFSNALNYACAVLKCGDYAKAKKMFSLLAYTKMNLRQKMLLKSNNALAYWKTDDKDTAIEMLETVIEKSPSSATYGSLGYMYICNNNYSKALEFNLKAYDYNSDNTIIVENLATTYCRMGDLENAGKYYKEALEKNPNYPDFYYEYGNYFLKCGEHQKGMEMLKKALDYEFSFLSELKKEDVLQLIKENEQ